MDILLINTNPIVSKLFQSFAEDKMIQLEEVSSVERLKTMHYDVIFIDESLCKQYFSTVLESFTSSSKVCISYDLEAVEGFDATLQKPFLPSQIMDILEDVSIMDRDIFSVLDHKEIEKIKSLLDMENLDKIDLGIESIEKKKLKSKNKRQKNKRQKIQRKNLNIIVKKVNKKALKRFLKGKEIKIRIQLTEEF